VKKTHLLIATTLLIVLFPMLAIARPDDADSIPLSNKDVLLMIESKMPADMIVTAIRKSACTFDTFPPVLRELKRRGVPEVVLQAMVQAPYGPSKANSSADALGDQAIYHWTEQLKPYLTPVPSTFRSMPRSLRTRITRTRNAQ
jgi:hypothetical protein